jgi:uncharacterized membrane protein YeaQ/YmgE (transglycosylase-associated protein family)
MSVVDSLIGWLAIGAAASLAGMIWPFLRGSAGVVLKMLLGPIGAIAGGLISRAVLPEESQALQLTFAAIGALVVLAVSQIAWLRYARAKSVPARA